MYKSESEFDFEFDIEFEFDSSRIPLLPYPGSREGRVDPPARRQHMPFLDGAKHRMPKLAQSKLRALILEKARANARANARALPRRDARVVSGSSFR